MASMVSTNALETTIRILPLTSEKIDAWMDANIVTRGGEEVPRLARFLDDAERGTRVIFAAWSGDNFLGHITVQDQSLYMPFRRAKMPEIVDLWVQPDYRRHGVGKLLLQAAVEYARSKKATAIGLGVGITDEFGPAHRLYALEDFKPDGMGAWANGVHVKTGDTITVNDGVLFMWAKEL